MIFWDRNKKFKFRASPSEIESNVKKYSTEETVGFHTFISLVLNIGAAIATYLFFGFNLFAFAIAFIVTDIVLVNIGWFGCYLFPYIATKRLDVIGAQKRVEKFNKQKTALEKKIDERDYMDYNERYSIDNEIETLEECISIEQAFIDAENTKIAEQKIQEDKRTNKDFDNKLEYFQNCKEKLKFYIDKKGIAEFKPVKTSVNKLIKVLQERPIGISMIPTTLYIYLDELQTIAEKLVGLSDGYTEKYSENIAKVSKLLQANITELIEKIDRCETNDIEVGLNVLLQELESSNDKKENNNTKVVLENINEKETVQVKKTSQKKKKGEKTDV